VWNLLKLLIALPRNGTTLGNDEASLRTKQGNVPVWKTVLYPPTFSSRRSIVPRPDSSLSES
jgi:hypothetical protein